MKHSISTRKEVTILKLEEPVFDAQHSEWFRTTIDGMVCKEVNKNVIVDFSKVKAIDSSGIGSMLVAHKLANSFDGLAIFVSLCQQIKDLLRIASLDKQLFIFSSINEVMTLIEPALKGKRAGKTRKKQEQEDSVDNTVTEQIEMMPDDEFVSDSFDEMDGESADSGKVSKKKNAKRQTTAKTTRKRGRPKKNPQADEK